MALGQTAFHDDGYFPEIATKGLEFVNTKSQVTTSRFKISYWKWMLKLTIIPVAKDDSGRWLDINDEKMITAIDQQKAAMLLYELNAMDKGTGGKPSYGIKYNKNIVFATKNNNDNKIYFVIRKFKDDMCTQYDKEAVYEFNTGKHFAIRDCDDHDTSKAQSIPYPQLEFNLLKTILTEYVKAFTGAQVGSMAYYGRDTIYDRANNNLAAIASKLGVELPNAPYPKGDSAKKSGSNKSSFANKGYSNVKKSLDDINDVIGGCLD